MHRLVFFFLSSFEEQFKSSESFTKATEEIEIHCSRILIAPNTYTETLSSMKISVIVKRKLQDYVGILCRFHGDFSFLLNLHRKQESIPVGCVPPAFLIPGGLPNPLETDPLCRQTPWRQTPTPVGRPPVGRLPWKK